MRNLRRLALALALSLSSGVALAAGLYTNQVPQAGGLQYPSTLPLTGNEAVPADTQLPSGANPATEFITTGQLWSSAANVTPRNYLDNGAMQVAQQSGAPTITCGTTSITALQFAADRWFCDANVGSGAGRNQIITASPAPPVGFTNSVKVWRNSGALTQQICDIQEVETYRATQLAGKNVIVSALLQPLAGMSGLAQVNAYIITGTGTDQGLGTLTASPAITPAWTGIAGGTTAAATWQLSTATAGLVWTRFNTPVVAIPSTATEVGVELCFTPGSTGAGATDGFAFTGVQLEATAQALSPTTLPSTNPQQPQVLVTLTNAQQQALTAPSPFEFRLLGDELRSAQRFFWQLNEPASGAPVDAACEATGASTNICNLFLPAQMRGTTPTITIGAAGTFKVNIAGVVTTIATPTASTCSVYSCAVTAANTNTAGQVELLTGGGGTGLWTVSSDVIM